MTSKNEVNRAEYIQSFMALFIPLSLFLATLICAAGTFLIYSGYALGWAFVAVAATMIVAALVAFVRFQNKLRVEGHFQRDPEDLTVDAS